MLLLFLSYLGGVLTIVSPCILPVLPFVFARANQPFVRSGLPLLVGMAVTFAAVASLAAVGGGWAVQANGYGRIAALAVLGLFGLLLLFPALADRATRPLVAIGARLSESASAGGPGHGTIATSLLLGVATGLLWAPCAGPILGLVLTGAALEGASARTSLLLLAYAAGAATSLALALLVGGRLFAAMKRSLGAGEWIRRTLGVLVIGGVVVVGLGLDTGFLTRLSLASTSTLEQALLDRLHPSHDAPAGQPLSMAALPIEGELPSLAGAIQWLNSPPLTAQSLRGKVVLIDFWTYSCINCLRSLPYVRAWAAKYGSHGLVVIGVHTPEFAFEKDVANVRRAVKALGIDYPVAIDNNDAIWRAFNNRYWPADYLIDGQGRIRYHHFGEGDDVRTEMVIQRLLIENGDRTAAQAVAPIVGAGVGAAASGDLARSPETYVGYARARNFVGAGGLARDRRHGYPLVSPPPLNGWSLFGDWTDSAEYAALNAPGGGIVYRFNGRDLNLVLGPAAGKSIRFRVLLDGKAPGADHGADIDANGQGILDQDRLYQLVRQRGPIRDRTFEIEFLDPDARAFAFTFG